VGKADLSRFGGMASAKERNPRAAVVWRAKGSLMEQLLTDIELPCHRVNPGDGERLRCVEGWKQQR
jgi:alkylated DNA nucleotide flippase Atl1